MTCRIPLLSSRVLGILGMGLLVCVTCFPARAQSIGLQRERGRSMLKNIKSDIQKKYYDPKYRGVDLDALFKEADEILKKAESPGQIFGTIAITVLNLNDSHTFFIPPSFAARVDYGWQMQIIGDECRVVAVKPGSDADAKGIKPGDLVLQVEGVKPTRETMWKLQYLYNTLRPQPGLRTVIQKGTSEPQQLDVMAKVTQQKRLTDLTDYNEYMKLVVDEQRMARFFRHQFYELKNEALIWKMPAFDLEPEKVDGMMNKLRDKKSLILDLRGNGGGYEITLQRMIGNLFDREIKLGDLVGREENKPVVAKTRGKDIFKGQVVVLIDSESGSSAELFARVIQMEKRGTVIGDRSAGAVMRARHISRTEGLDTVVFYGLSVTVNDLIMSDGKSLENLGVAPDEVVLPTRGDLAANLDPVLARAAALVGLKITPEMAGGIFPIEWR
jgi:C-terminal processing protease CtpA/Prc